MFYDTKSISEGAHDDNVHVKESMNIYSTHLDGRKQWKRVITDLQLLEGVPSPALIKLCQAGDRGSTAAVYVPDPLIKLSLVGDERGWITASSRECTHCHTQEE